MYQYLNKDTFTFHSNHKTNEIEQIDCNLEPFPLAYESLLVPYGSTSDYHIDVSCPDDFRDYLKSIHMFLSNSLSYVTEIDKKHIYGMISTPHRYNQKDKRAVVRINFTEICKYSGDVLSKQIKLVRNRFNIEPIVKIKIVLSKDLKNIDIALDLVEAKTYVRQPLTMKRKLDDDFNPPNKKSNPESPTSSPNSENQN